MCDEPAAQAMPGAPPRARARGRGEAAVPVLGAVLVGGASRRMGCDKALLAAGGEPLAARVARTVAEAIRIATGEDSAAGDPGVVLVGSVGAPGGPGAEALDELGLPRLSDRVAGRGPVAGLDAALHAAAARRPPHAVLAAACDLPGLDARLLAHLVTGAPRDLGRPWARVPRAGGRLHPLAALYSPACLPRVEARLAAAEDLSLHALLAELDLEAVEVEELPFFEPRLLANVNRPEEWAAWLAAERPAAGAAGREGPA